jgi:anti-sigma regulatory factor (Ser/Thr protein kinase)
MAGDVEEIQVLKIPATLDALEPLREYVSRVACKAGLNKQATYRLCLAVDELAANTIIHGYGKIRVHGLLVLKARINQRSISLILEDTGPPFDPSSIPIPDDLHAPPEKRKLGGLGIYLAIKSVDDFSYQYIDGRNCKTITMLRPANETGNSSTDEGKSMTGS